ncbi:MAG: MFS transporter, partial [Desulfobacterales bacterium]|nr:MFS transporter [Desulfobacterales bacterium]
LTGMIREGRAGRPGKTTAGAYTGMLGNRGVMAASGLVLVLAMMSGGIYSFLPVLVTRHFSADVGLVFMVIFISLIVFRFLTAQLSDRYGRGPCAFYSFIILCLSYYLIGRAQSTWQLVAAGVLNGVGTGGCLPALTAHVADEAGARFRGIAFSIFYGAYDVGMLLGGAALGLLADMAGLRGMYMLTALVGVFALGGFSVSIKPRPFDALKWTLVGPGRGGRPH